MEVKRLEGTVVEFWGRIPENRPPLRIGGKSADRIMQVARKANVSPDQVVDALFLTVSQRTDEALVNLIRGLLELDI